jgi:hypothetical protein
MQKNAYYVRIPKTGSTSMLRALEDVGGVNIYHEENLGHHFEHVQEIDYIQQGLAAVQRSLWGEDRWEECFTFAFVRNPWDRCVSNWKYLLSKREFKQYLNKARSAIKKKQPFHDRLRWHALPQFRHLVDDNGEYLVDFVGRFENMEQDFAYICSQLGVENIQLPHVNKTKHDHYSKYYDQELIDRVVELYIEDIEFFGYDFEDLT